MSKRTTKATRLKEAVQKSTEAKIINAATTLFNKNGYAGTHIRHIAKSAGVNQALLHYHFQNKQKLFENIMVKTTTDFVQTMFDVFNDKRTSLEKKIELCSQLYIDKLIENPNMAIFVVNEINRRPKYFEKEQHFGSIIKDSFIIKQIDKAIEEGKIKAKNSRIFLTNLLGLIIFPFLSVPIIEDFLEISRSEFNKLMNQRKKMIPIWIKTMFYN